MQVYDNVRVMMIIDIYNIITLFHTKNDDGLRPRFFSLSKNVSNLHKGNASILFIDGTYLLPSVPAPRRDVLYF